MTKTIGVALAALLFWTLTSLEALARGPASKAMRSTDFLAAHVNRVALKKCRAPWGFGTRLQWVRRHRIVHRMRRGRCTSTLPVPHRSAWLCIHRFEGSWTDSGDPYWGGLQMDRSFMSTYAPRWLLRKGWANSWTPTEQMWVAERSFRTRGFGPWPNTARYCGLL